MYTYAHYWTINIARMLSSLKIELVFYDFSTPTHTTPAWFWLTFEHAFHVHTFLWKPFSSAAALMLGRGTGTDWVFVSNYWPPPPQALSYLASFLFLSDMLDANLITLSQDVLHKTPSLHGPNLYFAKVWASTPRCRYGFVPRNKSKNSSLAAFGALDQTLMATHRNTSHKKCEEITFTLKLYPAQSPTV